MYDRVSQNPGRVLITPEDGSGAFYATLALADNPTVVGTPLNSANLLSQATAAALGLGPEAVPDAAFSSLSAQVSTALVLAATGTKTFARNSQTVDVSLGFKPVLVIIYAYDNNGANVGPFGVEEVISDDPSDIPSTIPIILSAAYTAAGHTPKITEDGFSYYDGYISSGKTANATRLYYVAFREVSA